MKVILLIFISDIAYIVNWIGTLKNYKNYYTRKKQTNTFQNQILILTSSNKKTSKLFFINKYIVVNIMRYVSLN